MERPRHAQAVRYMGIASLALALILALGTIAATTQLAGATGNISKENLKKACEGGHASWYETSDGRYGCYLPTMGFHTDCDSGGNCTITCDETAGCNCDQFAGGYDVCVHAGRTIPPVYQPPVVSGNQRASNDDQPTPAPHRPTVPVGQVNQTGDQAASDQSGAISFGSVIVNLHGCPDGFVVESASYGQLSSNCTTSLNGAIFGLAQLNGSSGTIVSQTSGEASPGMVTFTSVTPGSIRITEAPLSLDDESAVYCSIYTSSDPGPTSFSQMVVDNNAIEIDFDQSQSLYCDWFNGQSQAGNSVAAGSAATPVAVP